MNECKVGERAEVFAWTLYNLYVVCRIPDSSSFTWVASSLVAFYVV